MFMLLMSLLLVAPPVGVSQLLPGQLGALDTLNEAAKRLEAARDTVLGEVQQLGAKVQSEIVQLKKEVSAVKKNTDSCDPPVKRIPTDCWDVYSSGEAAAGVYEVQPHGAAAPSSVWCEKGWTVLQRRRNGDENFDRDFKDYKHGFGNVTSDYWAGLEFMHHLSSQYPYKMRLLMERGDTSSVNVLYYEDYAEFHVGDEAGGYRLYTTSQGSNYGHYILKTLGNNYPFSTRDRDRETNSVNCAAREKGGYWGSTYCHGNLNGNRPNKCLHHPICTYYNNLMKSTKMMLKPADAGL